jgi:hypothetical protein
MDFIVNNQQHFQTNSAIHNIDTSYKGHLHRPVANLSCFQNSAFDFGMKYLTVCHQVKSLMNKQAQFKVTFKRSLNTHFTLFMNS